MKQLASRSAKSFGYSSIAQLETTVEAAANAENLQKWQDLTAREAQVHFTNYHTLTISPELIEIISIRQWL